MSAVPQAFITTGISLWVGLSIGWICFGCAIAQSTVFFTTARAGALSRFQGIFLWFILGAAPLHQRSRGRLELMRLSVQHLRRGRPCLTSDGRQRVRPMQMSPAPWSNNRTSLRSRRVPLGRLCGILRHLQLSFPARPQVLERHRRLLLSKYAGCSRDVHRSV